MKILLVDDDAFMRDMYATKFREDGHTVKVTETGEGEALEALRVDQYDVVLMDMIMPGMTGVDLIVAIKNEKLPQEPTCIILSNQSEKHDMESALAAGAKGYIIKAEMIPSEVVAKVKQLVSNQ